MAEARIAVASDHAGFDMKQAVQDHLKTKGYDVVDLGTDGPDSVDYPEFGKAMAKALQEGTAERGVIVCGTGIGISIAANRYDHVRAAVCYNAEAARLARAHNDANVLALGARLIDSDTALACVDEFLETEFEGGRHARRVAQLVRD